MATAPNSASVPGINEGAASRRAGGLLRAGLWLLFAAAVARLWLMPLPSSFWVDETATAFVVAHPADPSFAVAPQVPASIYYWLPRAAARLAGFSEAAYRLPSEIAMLIAVWMIARISARLIHPASGWFAAFTCLAWHWMNYVAADARPYGLGVCVAACTVWFLIRYLDEARWADALGLVACAALVWRVHPVYWPFYLVLVAYAVLRLRAGDANAGWGRMALVFAAAAVLLVPVAIEAVNLARQAAAHAIVPRPPFREVVHLLRWSPLLIIGLAAWIVSKIFGWRGERSWVGSSVMLIFGWWLIHPAALCAYSWITGNSIYLARYLSIALPGAVLSAVWIAAHFLPARAWRPAAAVLGAGVLIAGGQWGSMWPAHDLSDWRGAAAFLNGLPGDTQTAVICPSPYVEARLPAWRPDYHLPGFLYSYLDVYPLKGRAILFPSERSLEAERYAEALLRSGSLQRASQFAIYGSDTIVTRWRSWFTGRPELDGWASHLAKFGDVYVVVFGKRPLFGPR